MIKLLVCIIVLIIGTQNRLLELDSLSESISNNTTLSFDSTNTPKSNNDTATSTTSSSDTKNSTTLNSDTANATILSNGISNSPKSNTDTATSTTSNSDTANLTTPNSEVTTSTTSSIDTTNSTTPNSDTSNSTTPNGEVGLANTPINEINLTISKNDTNYSLQPMNVSVQISESSSNQLTNAQIVLIVTLIPLAIIIINFMLFILLLFCFCLCTNTTIATITSGIGLLFGYCRKKRAKIGHIENKTASAAPEYEITNQDEMANVNLKKNQLEQEDFTEAKNIKVSEQANSDQIQNSNGQTPLKSQLKNIVETEVEEQDDNSKLENIGFKATGQYSSLSPKFCDQNQSSQNENYGKQIKELDQVILPLIKVNNLIESEHRASQLSQYTQDIERSTSSLSTELKNGLNHQKPLIKAGAKIVGKKK